ncbi:hypothetical protein [Desulfobotulus sp.]|jgi:hypothetical protein|uniref:hypothetical protein n=1 Tax=Desulfobotulus sp. TaxID=1940337 RepID=UPI002A35A84E|nr:hypothetical protein [Desulfobotulus sp.]MDY0164767.1 hypothetical protein [Desulfobotulus sp.]
MSSQNKAVSQNESDEDLQSIVRLFGKTEAVLKEIENTTSHMVVPVINELRYAGYHLTQYLQCKNAEDLSKAKNHCKRALFDAYDYRINLALMTIREFQQDYRLVNIGAIVNDYQALMRDVENIKKEVNSKIATHEIREERYVALEKHIENLVEIACRLNVAREELNKSLLRQRKNTFRFILTTIIGSIAAIAAIMAMF